MKPAAPTNSHAQMANASSNVGVAIAMTIAAIIAMRKTVRCHNAIPISTLNAPMAFVCRTNGGVMAIQIAPMDPMNGYNNFNSVIGDFFF